MTTITVTAKRWSGGWELWHADDCWTQAVTLDHAARQVRDYLDTVEPDADHDGWTINVIPEIGALGDEVADARKATAAAAVATEAAARKARHVAHHLREAGYSVTDSAAILSVSRGRVSQLINGSRSVTQTAR